MQKRQFYILIICLFLITKNQIAPAERWPSIDPPDLTKPTEPTEQVDLTNYLATPWTEQAKSLGLAPDQIKQLEKNKLLIIESSSYKKVSQPYFNLTTPSFVTSDCMLNAYHTLYQESIFNLELQMADHLKAILSDTSSNLDTLANQLQGDPELISKAREIASIMVGVPTKLLTPQKVPYEPSNNFNIEYEYKKTMRGSGLYSPPWLYQQGRNTNPIDYSRFTPRGFYTYSDTHARYFRAVSWLQAIPLNTNKDEHLLAVHLLASSIQAVIKKEPARKEIYNNYFESYLDLLGGHDDWNIMTAVKYLPSGTNNTDEILEQFRETLGKYQKDRSLINDQDTLLPDNPDLVALPNFRFISAHRVPSNILHTKTTDYRKFKRPFPKGVEIAALLDSSTAWDIIKTENNQKLIDTINECKIYIEEDSPIYSSKDNAYLMYITAMKYLLNDPDPRAPKFMSNDAWDKKSCNTVMASWTQQRYTWILQVKQPRYGIRSRGEKSYPPPPPPPGFVEPDPEFFQQMAKLTSQTKSILSELTVPFQLEYCWDALEENCKQLATIAEKQLENTDLNAKEIEYLRLFHLYLSSLFRYEQLSTGNPEDTIPRIVDIYTNNEEDKPYLHAAVGRSQRIYILYPWKEYTVLCSGTVIPYYELLSDQRLTDSDWRQKLDSPQTKPQQPDWIAPITSNK